MRPKRHRFAITVCAALLAGGIAGSPATADEFDPLRAAVDASPLTNVAVIVGTADGEVFRYVKTTDPNFGYDTPMQIASASKWLAGMMLMRMIEANEMQLTDHPQQHLSYWTSQAPRGSITLAQLLAFQSGFNRIPLLNGCVDSTSYTLQSCARNIYLGGVDRTPGAYFSYGPEHLHIAAAMAELAGGSSFNDLFSAYVTSPLGLTNTEFTLASASNPWVAGGAQSTANDFALVLQALLSGGFILDLDTFLGATSRAAGVQKLYVPNIGVNIDDWEFAYSSWVECEPGTGGANFNTQCALDKINSAPGGYGWVPWVDRQHGYWAVIATEDHSNGVSKGVTLEQALQPLIVTALQP